MQLPTRVILPLYCMKTDRGYIIGELMRIVERPNGEKDYECKYKYSENDNIEYHYVTKYPPLEYHEGMETLIHLECGNDPEAQQQLILDQMINGETLDTC